MHAQDDLELVIEKHLKDEGVSLQINFSKLSWGIILAAYNFGRSQVEHVEELGEDTQEGFDFME